MKEFPCNCENLCKIKRISAKAKQIPTELRKSVEEYLNDRKFPLMAISFMEILLNLRKTKRIFIKIEEHSD